VLTHSLATRGECDTPNWWSNLSLLRALQSTKHTLNLQVKRLATCQAAVGCRRLQTASLTYNRRVRHAIYMLWCFQFTSFKPHCPAIRRSLSVMFVLLGHTDVALDLNVLLVTMRPHVASTCFFHLRRPSKLKPHVISDTPGSLCHSQKIGLLQLAACQSTGVNSGQQVQSSPGLTAAWPRQSSVHNQWEPAILSGCSEVAPRTRWRQTDILINSLIYLLITPKHHIQYTQIYTWNSQEKDHNVEYKIHNFISKWMNQCSVCNHY